MILYIYIYNDIYIYISVFKDPVSFSGFHFQHKPYASTSLVGEGGVTTSCGFFIALDAFLAHMDGKMAFSDQPAEKIG